MIADLLPSLRVIEIPLKTEFRGIMVREVALLEGPQGLVEFSPFLEYGDEESSRWLQCTLEAASDLNFPYYREDVHMNGTIPATNDEKILIELLSEFSSVHTFKFKVGGNIQDDISRINFIKRARPDAQVRLDVNGMWDVDSASRYLREITSNVGDIEYVEQPCSSIAELRELKKRISIPIAADEVVRKAQDPFAVNLQDAADILVLKVQPLGGIAQSLAIAAHHSLPVVVSSALESRVGLDYGIRLAQSIEKLAYDCGLATEHLFAGAGRDVAPDRFEWWKNRIMRCAQLVEKS